MKIKRDHLLHAETSALLCIALALALHVWLAIVLALAAGIGKEIWDKYHDGVATWDDISWDAVGVIVGGIIAII